MFTIGQKVKSKMNWNLGEECTVINVEPPIYMNGHIFINGYVQLQYSEDPEDVSGWLSFREVEEI
jgi:hypothetical protein